MLIEQRLVNISAGINSDVDIPYTLPDRMVRYLCSLFAQAWLRWLAAEPTEINSDKNGKKEKGSHDDSLFLFCSSSVTALGAAPTAQTQPQDTQSHQSQGGGLRHLRHQLSGIGL